MAPINARKGPLSPAPEEAKCDGRPPHPHSKKRLPHLEKRGDWCVVPAPYEVEPILLECCAGDLMLWDSRTIHGGKVGTGFVSAARPARLSVTVAMTKRERATKEVLKARVGSFGWRGGGCISIPPLEMLMTFTTL